MSAQTLFTPLKIGAITLKNRIMMSALTRNRAENTYPTELMKEYYVQRAVGGAGVIVTEGILITQQGYVHFEHRVVFQCCQRLTPPSRTEWPHAPGLWDSKHVSGWKDVTDAVHEVGGKIYAQVREVYFN